LDLEEEEDFFNFLSKDPFAKKRVLLMTIRSILQDEQQFGKLPAVVVALREIIPKDRQGFAKILNKVKAQAIMHYARKRPFDKEGFAQAVEVLIDSSKKEDIDLKRYMKTLLNAIENFSNPESKDIIKQAFSDNDTISFQENIWDFLQTIESELPIPYLESVKMDIESGRYIPSSNLELNSIQWDEELRDHFNLKVPNKSTSSEDEEEEEEDDNTEDEDFEVTENKKRRHSHNADTRTKNSKKKKMVDLISSDEEWKNSERIKNLEDFKETAKNRRKSLSGFRFRIRYTQEEEIKLIEGVAKYGLGEWAKIRKRYADVFQYRTSMDLKDKWKNLRKTTDIEDRIQAAREKLEVEAEGNLKKLVIKNENSKKKK